MVVVGCQPLASESMRWIKDTVSGLGNPHDAAARNRVAKMEKYVLQGGDVNKPNKLGDTPLHEACAYIRDNGDSSKGKRRKGMGKDRRKVGKKTPTSGRQVRQGGALEMLELLLNAGSNINAQNIVGDAPLHKAALNGRAISADFLIRAGANVNIRNEFAQTPLHAACVSGNIEVVQRLVQGGADTNAQDAAEDTPFHEACRHQYESIVVYLMGIVNNPDTAQGLKLWQGLDPSWEMMLRSRAQAHAEGPKEPGEMSAKTTQGLSSVQLGTPSTTHGSMPSLGSAMEPGQGLVSQTPEGRGRMSSANGGGDGSGRDGGGVATTTRSRRADRGVQEAGSATAGHSHGGQRARGARNRRSGDDGDGLDGNDPSTNPTGATMKRRHRARAVENPIRRIPPTFSVGPAEVLEWQATKAKSVEQERLINKAREALREEEYNAVGDDDASVETAHTADTGSPTRGSNRRPREKHARSVRSSPTAATAASFHETEHSGMSTGVKEIPTIHGVAGAQRADAKAATGSPRISSSRSKHANGDGHMQRQQRQREEDERQQHRRSTVKSKGKVVVLRSPSARVSRRSPGVGSAVKVEKAERSAGRRSSRRGGGSGSSSSSTRKSDNCRSEVPDMAVDGGDAGKSGPVERSRSARPSSCAAEAEGRGQSALREGADEQTVVRRHRSSRTGVEGGSSESQGGGGDGGHRRRSSSSRPPRDDEYEGVAREERVRSLPGSRGVSGGDGGGRGSHGRRSSSSGRERHDEHDGIPWEEVVRASPAEDGGGSGGGVRRRRSSSSRRAGRDEHDGVSWEEVVRASPGGGGGDGVGGGRRRRPPSSRGVKYDGQEGVSWEEVVRSSPGGGGGGSGGGVRRRRSSSSRVVGYDEQEGASSRERARRSQGGEVGSGSRRGHRSSRSEGGVRLSETGGSTTSTCSRTRTREVKRLPRSGGHQAAHEESTPLSLETAPLDREQAVAPRDLADRAEVPTHRRGDILSAHVVVSNDDSKAPQGVKEVQEVREESRLSESRDGKERDSSVAVSSSSSRWGQPSLTASGRRSIEQDLCPPTWASKVISGLEDAAPSKRVITNDLPVKRCTDSPRPIAEKIGSGEEPEKKEEDIRSDSELVKPLADSGSGRHPGEHVAVAAGSSEGKTETSISERVTPNGTAAGGTSPEAEVDVAVAVAAAAPVTSSAPESWPTCPSPSTKTDDESPPTMTALTMGGRSREEAKAALSEHDDEECNREASELNEMSEDSFDGERTRTVEGEAGSSMGGGDKRSRSTSREGERDSTAKNVGFAQPPSTLSMNAVKSFQTKAMAVAKSKSLVFSDSDSDDSRCSVDEALGKDPQQGGNAEAIAGLSTAATKFPTSGSKPAVLADPCHTQAGVVVNDDQSSGLGAGSTSATAAVNAPNLNRDVVPDTPAIIPAAFINSEATQTGLVQPPAPPVDGEDEAAGASDLCGVPADKTGSATSAMEAPAGAPAPVEPSTAPAGVRKAGVAVVEPSSDPTDSQRDSRSTSASTSTTTTTMPTSVKSDAQAQPRVVSLPSRSAAAARGGVGARGRPLTLGRPGMQSAKVAIPIAGGRAAWNKFLGESAFGEGTSSSAAAVMPFADDSGEEKLGASVNRKGRSEPAAAAPTPEKLRATRGPRGFKSAAESQEGPNKGPAGAFSGNSMWRLAGGTSSAADSARSGVAVNGHGGYSNPLAAMRGGGGMGAGAGAGAGVGGKGAALGRGAGTAAAGDAVANPLLGLRGAPTMSGAGTANPLARVRGVRSGVVRDDGARNPLLRGNLGAAGATVSNPLARGGAFAARGQVLLSSPPSSSMLSGARRSSAWPPVEAEGNGCGERDSSAAPAGSETEKASAAAAPGSGAAGGVLPSFQSVGSESVEAEDKGPIPRDDSKEFKAIGSNGRWQTGGISLPPRELTGGVQEWDEDPDQAKFGGLVMAPGQDDS